MIETLVLDQIAKGATKTGFGIRGTVDQNIDSGIDHGTRTHGARLQGHVELTSDEAPTSKVLGRFMDRQDFGMGQWILIDLPTIEAPADDVAIAHYHRPDGNFPKRLRSRSGLKSLRHPMVVFRGWLTVQGFAAHRNAVPTPKPRRRYDSRTSSIGKLLIHIARIPLAEPTSSGPGQIAAQRLGGEPE